MAPALKPAPMVEDVMVRNFYVSCLIFSNFLKMDGLTDISPCSLRAQLGEKYAAHRDADASSILEDILRYICHCDVSFK